MIPGSAWSRAAWRAYLGGSATAAQLSRPQRVSEPLLEQAGLAPQGQVERPGGRGYLLWRRPGVVGATQ
jgi:hypothetical protein